MKEAPKKIQLCTRLWLPVPLVPAASFQVKYYVSKTLSTTNSVQLEVSVTVVGYYTIATATADGFAFSASGSFANTGLQNVILYASGTPAASGNFSFVAGTGTGCSFSVLPSPKSR